MRILAVESSAKTASVAIVENNNLISEFFLNTGLTHSETLMPMITSALDCVGFSCEDIDLYAVTNGPGSFTGVRIGVSAVKGMALSSNKKCVGVSTLEAMAYNLLGNDCTACCVMDARREQVYTAMFSIKNDKVIRLTEDSAMKISQLGNLLANYSNTVFFIGDGAQLCYNKLKLTNPKIRLAAENIRYQRAYGAAVAAIDKDYINSNDLGINYLRLPQAERELKKAEHDKNYLGE